MPKSRGRKKKVSKRQDRRRVSRPLVKPYEVVKQKLFSVNSPFPNDLPFEARLEILKEAAEVANDKFEDSYIRLKGFFADYDSLYLLSFSVFYFITEAEGYDREAREGKLDFPPFFMEVLQAFALMGERSFNPKPLLNESKTFKELVSEMNINQSFRYFKLAEHASSPDDMKKSTIRLDMMMQTLAIRNWAYLKQMEEVTLAVLKLIDEKFHMVFDVKATTLSKILFAMSEEIDHRANAHLRKIRHFDGAKHFDSVFERYREAFPSVVDLSIESRDRLKAMVGKNVSALKNMFWAHADLFLTEIFTFDTKFIISKSDQNISEETITQVFDNLSIGFGELQSYDKNKIFLENPVQQKPFIKVEDGKYFSSIAFEFHHFSFDIIEGLISTNASLKASYTSAKAKFLERRVEELFVQSFPEAKIFSGSQWHCSDTGKTFENDLLVIIDTFAIIVECKSGGVTPPAKRGAPERLQKTLQNLILDASEQAIRFKNYLKENRITHKFATISGRNNEVDVSSVEYFIPIGVTLTQLGFIGANLKKLIDAGLTEKSIGHLSPSISLTDLETIFHLLPTKAEKIHYLARRKEFEAHVQYQADELDLLAFYMETGFNIGDDEFNENFVMILSPKSKELDPYFVGRNRNRDVAKPLPRRTKFWNSVLAKFDSLTDAKWIEASYVMLNTSYEDQVRFERGLKQLESEVKRGKTEHDNNWMMLKTNEKHRPFVIVGYPFQNIDRETRNDTIHQIVEHESADGFRGIVILGFDLNFPQEPYSVAAGHLDSSLFDDIK